MDHLNVNIKSQKETIFYRLGTAEHHRECGEQLTWSDNTAGQNFALSVTKNIHTLLVMLSICFNESLVFYPMDANTQYVYWVIILN